MTCSWLSNTGKREKLHRYVSVGNLEKLQGIKRKVARSEASDGLPPLSADPGAGWLSSNTIPGEETALEINLCGSMLFSLPKLCHAGQRALNQKL